MALFKEHKENAQETSAINLQSLTEEEVAKMDDEELEHIGDKRKKPRPKRRKFESGWKKYLIRILTVAMALYHVFTVVHTISPLLQRAWHLLFVLMLVFLLYPATRKSPINRPSIIDWCLVAATLLAVGNLIIRFPIISRTGGGRGNQMDIICGAITIILVIEAARRAIGNVLPILAILVLLYGKYGNKIHGLLGHSGFSTKRIISHLTLTTEGIYGTILGVSSTFIFMFILFGSFLAVSGASRVFNDIALAIAGGSRGGPAKVAVLASGFMGSISGSSSANVVTTGVFTIPLMRRLGYKDYFASSVEAAASTGGQIMPPVMGSAAFIIADNLGLPFVNVIIAAVLPAILYYVSIWIMVDLRARKENISGLSKDELPKLKTVLKNGCHLLLPVVVIIVVLVAGYNAKKAALLGCIATVLASFIRKETRIKLKDLVVALESGSLSALSVAAACAVIGNMIGIASLTGVIMNLGAVVLKLGAGKLWLTMILTMISAIVLGMGLPTTAVYVLTSTIAAPTLIQMNVAPLAAHLFVFYYGILSSITPPVCSAAYTAAGLSGANPNKTGFSAVRLAISGFIIPFMFVYSPELLLPGGMSFLNVIRVIASSIIGVCGLALCMEGYYTRKLSIVERILCVVGAILMIDSGAITDIIGFVIIAGVVGINIIYAKKKIVQT